MGQVHRQFLPRLPGQSMYHPAPPRDCWLSWGHRQPLPEFLQTYSGKEKVSLDQMTMLVPPITC